MFNRKCSMFFILVLGITVLSCQITNISGRGRDWPPSNNPNSLGKTNEYASLVVESEPDGCEVYFDNKQYGLSPIRLEYLLPGRHTVRLRLTGYEDYERSVTLSEGRTKSINAKMKKIEYKNQVTKETHINNF